MSTSNAVFLGAAGCCANLTILPGASRHLSSYQPTSLGSQTTESYTFTGLQMSFGKTWGTFFLEGAFPKSARAGRGRGVSTVQRLLLALLLAFTIHISTTWWSSRASPYCGTRTPSPLSESKLPEQSPHKSRIYSFVYVFLKQVSIIQGRSNVLYEFIVQPFDLLQFQFWGKKVTYIYICFCFFFLFGLVFLGGLGFFWGLWGCFTSNTHYHCGNINLV